MSDTLDPRHDEGSHVGQALAVIAEASRLLGDSLDYETTLQNVVRLAVPRLADYAFVDLLRDDGTLRRVAISHVNPAREELLRRTEHFHPMNPANPVWKALRTGLPQLVEDMPSRVDALTHSPAHGNVVRELGTRSFMTVALVARGRTLGTLSMGTAESDRRYAVSDLRVAEELGRRAATAIDNARLFRSADEARHQAQATEARLRLVFAQAPVAIAVTWGPSHIFQTANARFLEIVGEREIVGRPARSALPELVGQGVFELLDGVYESGVPYVGPDTGIRLTIGGSEAPREGWINFVFQPLVEPHGAVTGIAIVGSEVTAQVRAREAAERLQRGAEAANRAKSEFLATMSHEFRTPLNAIMGYTQLLALGVAGALTDGQQEFLRRLEASGQHLLGLVNDVLDLARVDAGRLEVAREPERASEAVAAALALIRPQAVARQLDLVEVCDSDSPTGAPVMYLGDEVRVRQILVNLLSNAVKFTPPGGQVRVSCTGPAAADGVQPSHAEAGGPRMRFRVEDTGMGISEAQIATIFDPFVQAESGHTRRVGGSGLGLAISRRLARLMGGDLTVTSRVGAGSTFTLWLPAAPVRDIPKASAAPVEPLPVEIAASAPAAIPAADRETFAEVVVIGQRLLSEVHTVIPSYIARVRATTAVPYVRSIRDSQLADHAGSLITEVANALVVLGESFGQPTELLRDGSAIQRTIAELHGAQRHRLGWTEQDIANDVHSLRDAVVGAIHAVAPAGSPGAAYAADVASRLIDQAGQRSVHGLRAAAAAAQ